MLHKRRARDYASCAAVPEVLEMRSWRYDRTGGIATIELVVIAAVVLLAVGLAVPIVQNQVVATAKAQAIGDLRQMAADILNYYNDTGRWPNSAPFAFTNGAPAIGESESIGSDSDALHVSKFLVANKPSVPNWRGPYMSISRPDPWGHRYVIVLEGLASPRSPYGWILSAGPDGVFQTSRNDPGAQGDDLGLLLR